MEWLEDDDRWTLERAGCTVAEIRHAAPGEAEGSLGTLARHIAATRGVDLGPLSPAGFYWLGTVHKRGVWTRPVLAPSLEAAKADCLAAMMTGDYMNGRDG